MATFVATILLQRTTQKPEVIKRRSWQVVARLADWRRYRGKLLNGLTPRQRQILQLIAEGQSTKQIALSLNISVKTVETHRAQLMDRLQIHNIAGLVRYAMKNGLIQLED